MNGEEMTTHNGVKVIGGKPMRRGILTLMLIAMVFGMVGSLPYAHARVQPGDILVVDPEAGTNRQGALFRVDPVSGTHEIITDFGKAGGDLGVNPRGVAVSASGTILVIDPDAGTDSRGALFSIDPSTGNHGLFHDFGEGDEPLGVNPFALAMPSGDILNILVIDPDAGTGEPTEEGDVGNGALFRVIGSSREVVRDNLGEEPFGVAVRAAGEILVTERGFEFADGGGLFRVNPPARPTKVVFTPPNHCVDGNARTSTRDPFGVAIESSGTLLITDPAFDGRLFRVDLSAPVGQQCRVLSAFGDERQGERGSEPQGVAVSASSDILVVDMGVIFKIDPQNGRRLVLSDLRNPAEDPTGHSVAVSPSGIAIVSGMRPVEAPRPLLFVPGITGSSLRDDFTLVWPALAIEPGALRRLLTLNPDESQVPIYVIDALRIAAVLAEFTVKRDIVYKPLLDMLTDSARGGYREYQALDPEDSRKNSERRTSAGCDLSQRPFNPTLFVFPYDWRKSIADNAAALKDYVGCIQQFYPDRRVDILAHSMGSLLARRYILDNPGDHHVERMITIGGPWLGAPKASYIMETGDFIRLTALEEALTLTDNAELRREYKALNEFFKGTHQLLPSRSLFSFESQFFEDGWDINGNDVAFEEYTYDQFISLFNERFRSAPGTTGRDFHDNPGQDDWRNDNSGIQYLHIVGIKKHADTIGKVFATRVSQCVGFIFKACRSKNIIAVAMTVGDGTVPFVSAERRLRDSSSTPPRIIQDFNAPGARVARFFNLPDRGSEHTNLTKNGAVHQEILQFLGRGSSASPPTAQPLVTELDEEPLPAVEPALYLKVLGAMEVAVTDAVGDPAQGVISYILGAEDSRFLVLEPDQEYTVTFRSVGDPMALEITKGTDLTTTLAIRYHDLNLPVGVEAMLRITPQTPLGVEALKYDSDGDGTFDTEITPTAAVDGPDAEDRKPPVMTIQATPDDPGAPTTALVTLIAEDHDAGVKAIFFSLDGIHYQEYTGPLHLNPQQTPSIHAFADDNVGNRSSIVTFQIPSVGDRVIEVAIDIKPGSLPNSINRKSRGVIPVAILTTDTFDATTVDPGSVRFGPAEASAFRHKTKDVDRDGDQDLLLRFKIKKTGIQCGDTSASLTGQTVDGQAIEGSDSINTVGCE